MRKLFLAALAVFLVATAGRAADTHDKIVLDLIAQFKDPKNTPEVRSTAIRALGAMGWPGRSAVPELIKLLESPQERKSATEVVGAYFYTIESLGRMGPIAREAVPALVKAKGVAGLYDQAIDTALENILVPPPGTLFTLVAGLRNNDPSVRMTAAKVLQAYPVDAALVLPLLRDSAAKDPDPDVKRVIEEALKIVTKREVERLVQLLKDADVNVRLLAARALGQLGKDAAPAEAALKQTAEKDSDPDVKSVAKRALEKITAKP
jgi:HEAT repeat protein